MFSFLTGLFVKVACSEPGISQPNSKIYRRCFNRPTAVQNTKMLGFNKYACIKTMKVDQKLVSINHKEGATSKYICLNPLTKQETKHTDTSTNTSMTRKMEQKHTSNGQ